MYDHCLDAAECPGDDADGCLLYPVGSGFCTASCERATPCPDAPEGSTAIPACLQLFDDQVCALTCPEQTGCPAWMTCVLNSGIFLCV